MDRETYMQVIREHMQTSYLLKDDKINEILPRFFSSLQNHLHTLEEKLAEEDFSGLGVAGHKVKGALLNLGLFELADTASTIEQQGKQLDHDTDYSALIAHLKHSITIITGA